MSSLVTYHTVSEADSGIRLDRWVKRLRDIPHGQLEKLLRTGQIRVDGRRVKAKERLIAGCSVRLPPILDIAQQHSPSPRIDHKDKDYIRGLVIYEDEDIIALNKPSGIAVQGGTKTHKHIDGLLDALSKDNERPKLVHRLDKDTSGVLLLAKNSRVATHLGKMFRSREISKIYWAVTVGVPNPKSGQLRGWMAKGISKSEDSSLIPQRSRERMYIAKQNDKNAVHAITDYAVVSTAGQKAAWVALRPHTGRTHQLRLHLSELGASVLGDRKYKTQRDVPFGISDKLHLHSSSIIIPNGSIGKKFISAPLPVHMKETFATLGFLEEEVGTNLEDIFK